MSRYLGNKNTMEVHDTYNEKEGCQLDEIKPDHKEGFDNCAHCIGNSRR